MNQHRKTAQKYRNRMRIQIINVPRQRDQYTIIACSAAYIKTK